MFRQEARQLQKIGCPFCPKSRSTEVKLIFTPFNAELNPICHLLALLGAHHILHVSSVMGCGSFSATDTITRKGYPLPPLWTTP
jgi:hypothetical protein